MTLKELYNELNELQSDITKYIKLDRCGDCVNSHYIPETGQFRCELLRDNDGQRKIVNSDDFCCWGASWMEDEE